MKALRVLVLAGVGAAAFVGAYVVVQRKVNPGTEAGTDNGASTAAGTAKPAGAGAGAEPLVRTLEPAVQGIVGMALSADGKVLAIAGSDKVIHILDAVSGAEMRTLPGEKVTKAMSLSADGGRLAAFSPEGTTVVWDTRKGEIVTLISQHLSMGGECRITPNGAHVVTITADALQVWNTESGDREAVVLGQTFQAGYADNEQIVAGTLDGSVVVMDLATGAEEDRVKRVSGAGDENPFVFCCTFWGDHDHVLFGDQFGAWLWDRTARRVKQLSPMRMYALAAGSDGHWMGWTANETIGLGMDSGFYREINAPKRVHRMATAGALGAALAWKDNETPAGGYTLYMYDGMQLQPPAKKRAPLPWSDQWK